MVGASQQCWTVVQLISLRRGGAGRHGEDRSWPNRPQTRCGLPASTTATEAGRRRLSPSSGRRRSADLVVTQEQLSSRRIAISGTLGEVRMHWEYTCRADGRRGDAQQVSPTVPPTRPGGVENQYHRPDGRNRAGFSTQHQQQQRFELGQ